MAQLTYAFLGLFLFTSCISSTLITSTPSEADVYVDNDLKGKTPYKYEDEKIVLSKTEIILKKEGYEDKHATLQRDEEIELVPAVAGFVVWPAWLWALGYEDEHNYILTKKEDFVLSPIAESTAPFIESVNDLFGLYQEGILTDSEFTTEKKKLIESEISYSSKTDFLKELKMLLDNGAITNPEFEEIKARVLEQ